MHGIQRRGGAGRRIFQPLLCLLLACALLSRFSSASAEYGADFDYLHTLNPDIAGWLYSEDGLIDQAVLQAADNQTYRKLRYDRSTYYYGSVFMDCEASADFSDPVTILYGSPGIDEGPFSFLRDYMEKDYALTHSRLLLLTPNGNQDIQLFAAFTVPYDDEESWRLDQADTEAAFQQALKTQTERSVFSLPENLPEYGDRVLVMATTGDSRQRMVVMGKLTAREPSADVTDIFKKELDDRETGNGRVTIDGVGSFMVYAQNDPVYARLTFEVASSKKYRIFGHGGCGPTAAAMILANLLTSEELTRLDQFTENGEGFYFCPCSVNQFHCQSYHVKYHPTSALSAHSHRQYGHRQQLLGTQGPEHQLGQQPELSGKAGGRLRPSDREKYRSSRDCRCPAGSQQTAAGADLRHVGQPLHPVQPFRGHVLRRRRMGLLSRSSAGQQLCQEPHRLADRRCGSRCGADPA